MLEIKGLIYWRCISGNLLIHLQVIPPLLNEPGLHFLKKLNTNASLPSLILKNNKTECTTLVSIRKWNSCCIRKYCRILPRQSQGNINVSFGIVFSTNNAQDKYSFLLILKQDLQLLNTASKNYPCFC